MPNSGGYRYDEEYDEHYVPDQDQCRLCSNKAEVSGICISCWEETEWDYMNALEEDN